MKTKQQLRDEMLTRLKEIDEKQYEQWSNEIAKKLFSHESWMMSETIAIVISRKPEVNTKRIIEYAWELGKRVVVPKCHPKTKTMTFHAITTFDQLEVVYYGLKEPILTETVEVTKNEIDLMIVPGLIFMKNGYRLGFGGGYYDRYLANYRGKKLALAFDIQLAEYLPIESYDIPVDTIITNKEVLTCDHR